VTILDVVDGEEAICAPRRKQALQHSGRSIMAGLGATVRAATFNKAWSYRWRTSWGRSRLELPPCQDRVACMKPPSSGLLEPKCQSAQVRWE
jgi:hypothetical protein